MKKWKKTKRALFFVILTFSGFMLIPEMVLTEWLGITSMQQKVVNLQNALFWDIRSRLFSGVEQNQQIKEEYGQLLGMIRTGDVALNVADGDEWEKKGYVMAGIRIRDVYRSAVTVGALRDTTIKVDVYPSLQEKKRSVVIWAHGTPVNLALIEDGHAVPEPRPVTNIMAKAYASYYWRLVKKGGMPAKSTDSANKGGDNQ